MVWLHETKYGVEVLKNREICDFVESRPNTEKVLLTSKSETYYYDRVMQVQTFCQEQEQEHEQFAILPLSNLALCRCV